jgi:exopolysaccharide biosynthesis polyprenyl glycosylphosphotransferase
MTTPDSPLRDSADHNSAGEESPRPTRNAIVTSNQIDATPTSPSIAEHGNSVSGVPAAQAESVEPYTGANADHAGEARAVVSQGRENDSRPRTPWRRAYATRLWFSDLFILVWAVYGAQLLWFGFGNAQVSIREDSRLSEFSYWLFSSGLVIAWMWALTLVDSRDHRVIGSGTTEYVRIARAGLSLFGLIAILAFLLRVDVARGYLLIALPLGLLMLLFERWMWRQWLIAYRALGEYSARVLLIGSLESVSQIARELRRSPSAGYAVVGACIPSGKTADTVPGTAIPIVGEVGGIESALKATGADTVAITSTDDLPPSRVKEISWSLESGRQHLVLAPSIVDIAGPRIHTRPVAGLPLIHVETPRFSVGQKVLKRAFDIGASLGLLLLLSPLLAAVALAVRFSSRGPILYSHERIGLHGRPFRMLKFRSMRVGADTELRDLLAAQGKADQPLFKVANDPRITPVGKVIRKYSLDELPQLLNVLGGSMSIVGPRPQIAAEVNLYTEAAKRRLLAKPGMTGLWQVSGRSGLEWSDAIRLDLYYVENWSFLGDLAILLKTVRAVIAPGDSAH